jgi:thiosulfate sulfurtransferase
MATAVSTGKLAERLASTNAVQIVDVRRKPVFDNATHLLPAAVWKNPEDVHAWLSELDRSRPVVVYCVHGHLVSQGCADVLTAAGFEASYLEGGIAQWTTEGRSIQVVPARSER